MISTFRSRTRMNRMYHSYKETIYTNNFFEELSSGYSYILGEKDEEREFLTFEPLDCNLSKLINGKHLRYEIEEVINEVTYSLMAFGKAYVYIKPEYALSIDHDNNETKVLSSIEIREVKGFVKKQNKTYLEFCLKGYNGDISDIEIQRKQLIMFDIKDLGYSRKYFKNILKKLGKCDIIASSTSMINNNLDGYDFMAHSKKNKLKELRALKDIGWSFGTDGLSDSYILYKKIQEDKLRLQFLNYILEKLNFGFEEYIVDAGGKLVAHVKEKNYDQLWKDYSDGKLTGTELSNILYHK